ncbi:hypothetical protein PR202_gb08197 [Eleusine coracana subsp. coracana]|uniref:ATRX ADD domain-containing protein n=1 Tax=Eleusine coracana subsp. coracana TaxID=191504 RepID=A0AAV5EE44_ELECO|nr:hypothetical protein PR202_gb08197 [Eleusine coracana subsp. coracana]
MDKNGILSDDKIKNVQPVQANGQLGDEDVIIIDAESDENKVGAKSDGLFKEHSSGTMDDGLHEEASVSDDDSEIDSYESFLHESDNEQASASEEDIEVPLTEEEVEELITEFLEVESKAAQAQESLEKESLEKIEAEVRLELSERLQGDELESAVSSEMEQFKNQWENELDDLEIRNSTLLEELDAAGIELPRLYKSIEGQVPNVCETETWKSRTHWVGSQLPEEANQSIKEADEYLQSCRPVRRKHGRLLEEGASGFLAGKVPVGDDDSIQCHEKSWTSFSELIKSKESAKNTFGSTNWASVYLASTPQEAAALGLQFPGVDEVEEISEVDCAFADIKCIDEVELSEEQRRKYRKVREEDDAKIIKRMQCHMKRRRARGRHEDFGLASSSNEKPPSNDSTNGLISSELKTDENKVGTETLKRAREHDDELDEKRLKTVIIESDDDMQIDSKSDIHKDGEGSSVGVEKEVDIIDLDLFSSQSPKLSEKKLSKAFKCTICTNKLNASDVHRHPVLDVTVCGSCRILYLVVIVFGVHKVNNFKVVVLARQDHLKSMQEQSASKIRTGNIRTSFGGISYATLEDAGDGHIVNLAREEDEEPVRIPSSMSSKLKTHQV